MLWLSDRVKYFLEGGIDEQVLAKHLNIIFELFSFYLVVPYVVQQFFFQPPKREFELVYVI